MSDYVVSLNGKKRNIKVIDDRKVRFDGKEVEYSLSQISEYSYLLKVGNRIFDITANPFSSEKNGFLVDGHYFETVVRTRLQEKAFELQSAAEKQKHHDLIKAPMPGLIIRIKKKIGDPVEMGESVVILEAMKMENDLRAQSTGIIKEIFVSEGVSVEKDTVLLSIG